MIHTGKLPVKEILLPENKSDREKAIDALGGEAKKIVEAEVVFKDREATIYVPAATLARLDYYILSEDGRFVRIDTKMDKLTPATAQDFEKWKDDFNNVMAQPLKGSAFTPTTAG